MLIDCHAHVLSYGTPEVMKKLGKEAALSVFRAQGKLPAHRLPTDEEWDTLKLFTDKQAEPDKILKDYQAFDKVVLLSISPSPRLEMFGTIDNTGVTDVPGLPTSEKCNDYIAAFVRKDPEKFIGFASVNPALKGPKAAVKELERSINDLKLKGLKLYPIYQWWSPDDKEIAFPIFEKAEELDIPVMIHMAGTSFIDPPMKFSNPLLLDDVGREFRKLRIIIPHMSIPFIQESLYMMTKHPNFYGDLSFYISTIDRETLYRFLLSCKPFFVPLAKLFFGSDYPSFNATELVNKLKTVNEEAERLGKPKIPEKEIEGLLGNNFAKFFGLDE